MDRPEGRIRCRDLTDQLDRACHDAIFTLYSASRCSRHLARCDGPLCCICSNPRLSCIYKPVNKPHNGLFDLPKQNPIFALSAPSYPQIHEMLVVRPHESLLKGPTLDASYSSMQAAYASANFDAAAPEHCHSTRDPHHLPDFSSSDPQSSPVLFLPPLLSSLPHGLSHTPAPSPDQQPLTTETHLPDIDPASLSLHKALHYFSPVTPQYAILPYAESFNWDSLKLPEDQEREWYVVAFRSKRRPGSDSGRESEAIPDQDRQILTTFLELYEADRRAHEEAVQNGGVSLPFHFFHKYRVNAYQRLAYHVLVRRARLGG